MLVDASHPLTGAACTQVGVTGAIRYLSSIPGPKICTAAEMTDLPAHDVTVTLIYEDTTLDMAGGAQHGYYHGAVAAWEAAVLGLPAGCGIYLACDTPQVPAGTRDTVTAAAQVIRAHGWRPGWYGNPDAGRLLLGAGIIDLIYAVQTWGTRDLSYCHLVQIVGSPVTVGDVAGDLDQALTADWGQHPRPPAP